MRKASINQPVQPPEYAHIVIGNEVIHIRRKRFGHEQPPIKVKIVQIYNSGTAMVETRLGKKVPVKFGSLHPLEMFK